MIALEKMKGSTHRRKTKIGRISNFLRYKLLSWLENRLIAKTDPLPLISTDCEPSITVSLTSYPGRIYKVATAIKSIMLQTMCPNRVILWLAEEQFPNHQLPQTLEDLKEIGVEIYFCKGDLRSHKKYFYALQCQKPGEVVLTIDDDIIYHPLTIERAMEKHRLFPNAVICNSAHVVTFDESDNPLPYSRWKGVEDFGYYSNEILTPLTGSGCLYPYGVMPKTTFDVDLIKSTSFTADDLWIAAMINVNHIELIPTDIVARTFTTVTGSQNTHLGQVNCIENGNDVVINKLIKVFPQFLSRK